MGGETGSGGPGPAPRGVRSRTVSRFREFPAHARPPTGLRLLRLRVVLQVLCLLFRGRALLRGLLARGLGPSVNERLRPASLDGGEIRGRSARRTAHLLDRDGSRYWLCCAVDILLNADGPESVGKTRCPVCGKRIRIRTRDGAVRSVVPRGAVVNSCELILSDGRREVCCDGSAIFDSGGCRERWTRMHPDRVGVGGPVRAYTLRWAGTERPTARAGSVAPGGRSALGRRPAG